MTARHKVEVVVHVDDVFAQEQRDTLVRDLQKREGVEKAQFTAGRDHLLVVDYDRDRLQAQDVLNFIRHEHIGAELVGPI
jgi:multidrug efflux pump subunit AcrB